MRSILSLHYSLSSSEQDAQHQCDLQRISSASRTSRTVSEHDVEAVDVAEGGRRGLREEGGTVPWVSLYRGADSWDVLALVLGTLGATVSGLVFPSYSLIFGQVRAVGPIVFCVYCDHTRVHLCRCGVTGVDA